MYPIQQRAPHQSKAVKILRWIAVAPAAILGGFLARWVIVAVNAYGLRGIGGLEAGSLVEVMMSTLLGEAVLGAALVSIAVYVAPSHKGLAAMFFASAWIVVTIGAFVFAYDYYDWKILTEFVLASLVSAGIAYETFSKSKVSQDT